MNTSSISTQLANRFAALDLSANNIPVLQPGQVHELDSTQTWVRLTFNPDEPTNSTNNTNLLTGSFQCTVHMPVGEPAAVLDTIEAQVLALFPRGLTISDAGINIEITKSYPIPRYQVGQWYQGAVIVLWRSLQDRLPTN